MVSMVIRTRPGNNLTLDEYEENSDIAVIRRVGLAQKILRRNEVYERVIERNNWKDKIWEILKHDSFEHLPVSGPTDYYLYHPLPGRKMYHILTVEYGISKVKITCSCQGMMKNGVCTHAVALRIASGFGKEHVIYDYKALGEYERDLIRHYGGIR